jgi:hypothetical protein
VLYKFNAFHLNEVCLRLYRILYQSHFVAFPKQEKNTNIRSLLQLEFFFLKVGNKPPFVLLQKRKRPRFQENFGLLANSDLLPKFSLAVYKQITKYNILNFFSPSDHHRLQSMKYFIFSIIIY